MIATTKHKHKVSSEVLFTVIGAEKNNNGAEFTVLSKRSGKDYTFKISRKLWNDKWYTHVYVETNYLEFKRLGTYVRGSLWNKGSVVVSDSAKAIAWVLKYVENKQFADVDAQVDVMHLGRCLRCGKKLTDANSIDIGLGPVCVSL